MKTSGRAFLKYLLLPATAFTLAGLVGCAEPLTYSKDAQRSGEKMFQQGDYTNAAGAFRESVRQVPNNYRGWYYLGLSDLKTKNYQDAIVSFRQARGLIGKTLEGKRDAETHNNILTGLATAIAKSDQRDAETDAVAKEASDYSSGEAYFLLGQIHAFRDDPDSAIDAFNRASLIDSENFAVFKTYGLYLIKVGLNAKAEAPLRRAYDLNPGDADVNAGLRRLGATPGGASYLNRSTAPPPPPGIINHVDTASPPPRD